MSCVRFLEADWATHGHVTRDTDCLVVVTLLSRGIGLLRSIRASATLWKMR